MPLVCWPHAGLRQRQRLSNLPKEEFKKERHLMFAAFKHKVALLSLWSKSNTLQEEAVTKTKVEIALVAKLKIVLIHAVKMLS